MSRIDPLVYKLCGVVAHVIHNDKYSIWVRSELYSVHFVKVEKEHQCSASLESRPLV